MKKKCRKPHPSPPHWYWYMTDNCWLCNFRNNCSNCSELKFVRLCAQKKIKRYNKLKDKNYIKTFKGE